MPSWFLGLKINCERGFEICRGVKVLLSELNFPEEIGLARRLELARLKCADKLLKSL